MEGHIEPKATEAKTEAPRSLASERAQGVFDSLAEAMVDIIQMTTSLYPEKEEYPDRWNSTVRDYHKLREQLNKLMQLDAGVLERAQELFGPELEGAYPTYHGDRIPMTELKLSPRDVQEDEEDDELVEEWSWPSRRDRRERRRERRRRSAPAPTNDDGGATVAGSGFGVFRDSGVAAAGMIGLAISKYTTEDDVEPSQLSGNRRNVSQLLTDVVLIGGMAAFLRLGMLAMRGHNVFDFLFDPEA